MINDLINRLQKCPEYSCSRCTYYGTPACAIREAIVELKRYDQIFERLWGDSTNMITDSIIEIDCMGEPIKND